jgi:hypothetical protein
MGSGATVPYSTRGFGAGRTRIEAARCLEGMCFVRWEQGGHALKRLLPRREVFCLKGARATNPLPSNKNAPFEGCLAEQTSLSLFRH